MTVEKVFPGLVFFDRTPVGWNFWIVDPLPALRHEVRFDVGIVIEFSHPRG